MSCFAFDMELINTFEIRFNFLDMFSPKCCHLHFIDP